MSGLVLSVYNAVSELPSGAVNGTMAWISGSTNRLYISNGTGWYALTLTTYIRPAQLVRTIDNPNPYGTSNNDRFGSSLKITNTHMVVGVPLEDDDPEPYVGAGEGDYPGATGEDSGKVYIYELSTGNLIHTLNNPNPNQGVTDDEFGTSVGINSTQVLVATPNEDNSPTYLNVGKAYVYDISTGNLSYTIDNPDTVDPAGSQFGIVSDMSENHIIIGARLYDGPSGNGSGRAYIFNASNGSLLHTLENPNAYVGSTTNDIFGSGVAINGDYAIVSAYQEGDPTVGRFGKAYIFDITTGNLLHTLDNPRVINGVLNEDYFGYRVGISSTKAIVTEYWTTPDDGSGTPSYSGTAFIYDLATGALEHTLENPNPYGTVYQDYAHRCAISDSYAIVGATGEDEASGDNSGKAYVFDVDNGSLLYTLDNPNAYGTVADDSFGTQVAVSDDYIVVSASGEDDANGTSSGKVYIFAIDQIAPVITGVTDANAGTSPFTLATDGTPTVITVTAADGNADTLTYSYSVSSGTLGDTTVSQADNVFTITPSTTEADAGTFGLTFTATDGVQDATSVANFSLAFTAMYGDRGLFAGGNSPSASNAVEYIDITTASDAATFGTLSTGISHGGTASNGTIGIFYGINANTAASNRDYFTIPSNPGAVTASEAGALSTGRKEPGSAGDGTYGTFAGSVPTSSNSNTTLNSIEYITIATTSAGATFANLSATTGSLAGASDGTNAYYFGGYNYNLTSNWDNNRIETLVIATQGQQSSFGNLASDRYNHSAAGNETYGVIAGGGPDGTQTPNSTIERIAYATQTTATSFGSLNGGGRWKNGSLNNETYAIFAGGYTLGPDTYYGTMNFVTIDGAGGSSAFGNLGTNRGDGVRGVSGSPA